MELQQYAAINAAQIGLWSNSYARRAPAMLRCSQTGYGVWHGRADSALDMARYFLLQKIQTLGGASNGRQIPLTFIAPIT